MSKLRTTALVAAAGAAVLASTLTAPTATAAGPAHGCPYGAVCVYPQNTGWNGDRPSLVFYSYGGHNLSNQYGTHRVFNNQYDRAWATGCSGWNGTGNGTFLVWAGYSYDANLTPTNSIKLTRYGDFTC